MTDKTSANLAKVRAEKFGENLSEALDIMIDFSLENKFDCYSIEEQNQLERVLEILTDCFDMWDKGQIILVSKERETIE
ncbi:hypothetical protein HMPREF9318_01670 [Streptococcus urinalis FB127-CNA-2]|uniref:Uncharacterized protein n=1 Tax=Streptococcus urinalis 2285-97 TaxID=764291 RepID=G5KEV3_9STRE|nr:hypothetical protein [Streptococcus urinalis]QBX12141.1 hypothetical protein JavanS641_0008 [Streptococcus satellite phage Javan641]QBX12156.1 hypothetical protein JavanS643_0008 [Streptococcus satellite phage Javan643]QBX12185.1 hypothetical protein JavanS646_0008 [Streptococcus satellite phage Javan646]QBX12226.1 hypothetical protein JavanS650_0008 [Streptococcus satellite phage Javan650]EHJ56649.1 hypothetical protein STRUR_2162 [Streptococcus urinalis 2285-97]